MAIPNSDMPVIDSHIPGLGTSGWYVAGQGTDGAMAHPGSQLGEQHVSAGYDPNMSMDVAQGYDSTDPGANNPNYEKISAVTSPTDWSGTVIAPRGSGAGDHK